jgi:hypothetical protein
MGADGRGWEEWEKWEGMGEMGELEEAIKKSGRGCRPDYHIYIGKWVLPERFGCAFFLLAEDVDHLKFLVVFDLLAILGQRREVWFGRII